MKVGSRFDVEIEGSTYKVEINVPGKAFVYNALCGICIGIKNDIPVIDILEGLRNFELTKNRMEIIEKANGVKVISDCYNASYDSMRSALEFLGKTNSNKKIAILGDMLELGEFSKELHEKVGEEVVKSHIDILITCRRKQQIYCK